MRPGNNPEKIDGVQLRRALGLRETVALGVGGTIGGGIFVLIGAAAGYAGPAVLLSFVLAFLAALFIALPYAELACRYPIAGGGYAFTRAVLGRNWGFLMGWGYWGAYIFASGYVTLGFGGYLNIITGIPVVYGALALITVSTAINLVGVRISGRVQTSIVLLAIGALLGFAVTGLPHVQLGNLSPFFPQGANGVIAATLLAFLAFGGFDMVAAAGEEVTKPERNLPVAILLTLGSVLGLYLLVTFVAVGVLSWNQLGVSHAPLSSAASRFLGSVNGPKLIALAAVFTTAATSNAVLVVSSRIAFAMARDGLLPKVLSHVHKSTSVPWIAVLLNGALLAIVALMGSIAFAAAAGGFLYVLNFLFPLVAFVALRHRNGGRKPSFCTPLPHLVLPLAFASTLVLLIATGKTGILAGLTWLSIGLVVYLTARGLKKSFKNH
ncbi:amino acid permease [Candidatus Bathyarchaeota archaeon]|nr:amino acid permease [Candidatus Bathyarchaeota archaeon]